jgi:DNA polymerase III subunit epsilon
MPDPNDLFTPPAPRQRFVVFDTETNGLFQKGAAADDITSPRLACLAMVYTDTELRPFREETVFIQPDGWYMNLEAGKANGLTTAFLKRVGRPVHEALLLFKTAIEEGFVFAAHNAQFDCKIMRGEFRRAGLDDMFEQVKNVCTMRKSVGVCKIPYADPKKNGYKFPKLAEAMAHWKLRRAFVQGNKALGDARDALSILQALDSIGIDLTPEVHYAKNRPIDKAFKEHARISGGDANADMPEGDKDAGRPKTD